MKMETSIFSDGSLLSNPNQVVELLLHHLDESERADQDYVNANYEYEKLEKHKDIYLESLIHASIGKTTAEKRRNAMITTEWGDYLGQLIEASKTRQIARAERDAHKLRVQAYITLISLIKREIDRLTCKER